LYAVSGSRLTAYDADLNELWETEFDETAIDGNDQHNGSTFSVLRGPNIAIEDGRSEVLVALDPNSWPAGTNIQDYLFVGRFDKATGAYVGWYQLPGASQALLSVNGTLFYNSITSVSLPFNQTLEVHRFKSATESYLETVETP